jgi:hypothetical protein
VAVAENTSAIAHRRALIHVRKENKLLIVRTAVLAKRKTACAAGVIFIL